MLRQCLGSAIVVEQPPTAIPVQKHGQAKIDQELPRPTTSTRFSELFERDLDVECCVTGPLDRMSMNYWIKIACSNPHWDTPVCINKPLRSTNVLDHKSQLTP